MKTKKILIVDDDTRTLNTFASGRCRRSPWLVPPARAPMSRWMASTLRLRHGLLITAMPLTAPCSTSTMSVPMRPRTPMNTSPRSAIPFEKHNNSGHAVKRGVSLVPLGIKCCWLVNTKIPLVCSALFIDSTNLEKKTGLPLYNHYITMIEFCKGEM